MRCFYTLIKMLKIKKYKLILLNERGQTQEVAYCMFTFMRHSKKDNIIEMAMKLVVFRD